jgi:hypothetical protein
MNVLLIMSLSISVSGSLFPFKWSLALPAVTRRTPLAEVTPTSNNTDGAYIDELLLQYKMKVRHLNKALISMKVKNSELQRELGRVNIQATARLRKEIDAAIANETAIAESKYDRKLQYKTKEMNEQYNEAIKELKTSHLETVAALKRQIVELNGQLKSNQSSKSEKKTLSDDISRSKSPNKKVEKRSPRPKGGSK